MSSAYNIIAGTPTPIAVKLTTTDPTAIAGSATERTHVVWFQCAEIAGATPTLTVEIYNAATTTSYYLRNALAFASGRASVLFENGITLEKNQFLRVTAGAANQVDVVGMALLNTQQT
jgi:hypothetical protein